MAGEIVFSSNRGGPRTLWKVSASGGSPKRLAGVGENALFPTIARQGRRLAYVESRPDLNIWRVDLQQAASSPTHATKLAASTRDDGSPQYSPDGKRIAFRSSRSGTHEVWVSDSDGSNLVQLTSFGASSGSPRWSPDGGQIAFDSAAKGSWDIYVINSEGGAAPTLVSDASEDSRPSWSKDGRWIYFNSDRTGTDQIWKVPVGGGPAVQVTGNGGRNPHESPDGKFIYYGKTGEPGLFRMAVEGGKEIPIIEDLQGGARGCWAVTDKGVYFAHLSLGSEGYWPVKFLDLATGCITEVLRLDQEPIRLTVSPDGRWLLHTQDDSGQDDIMLVENFR